MENKHKYDLFISYAETDAAWVEDELLPTLKVAGLNYHDATSFSLGMPRLAEFERAIKESQRTLLILSPEYLAGNFSSYLDILVNSYGIETGTWPVIPLVLRPVELPVHLSQLVVLDAVDPRQWNKALNRLIQTLDKEVPERPKYISTPGEPPYMGLQFYDVQDADRFYGREKLTAKLVGRLRENTFLAIVGASGSGKSSIVRAGLVSALKTNKLLADETEPPLGSDHWSYHIITPTAHPLESLAVNLTQDHESVTATAALIDDLSKDERSLHLFIRRLLTKEKREKMLLVIDQFEEIFTLCKDPVERKTFIENLLTAVKPETAGPTILVLTLRADFYHHCAQHDKLRQAIADSQEYIGLMNALELRQAIETPALNNGWDIETGLVDLILQDIGADGDTPPEPGALPLLSHALLETWQHRRGKTLTLGGYVKVGGVRGAIGKTADSVYQSLEKNQQKIAKGIFLRLTELGEETQDTRRRAALDELFTGGEDKMEIENILNILASARLISLGKKDVEVAHEALIREWRTLRAWLEEDRNGLRIHRHLTKAAKEWERLDHDPGELYRGSRLGQAEAWAQEYGSRLSELESDFLTTSRSTLVAEEQAQVQARKRARRTPIYSFIGGALGFALSFLLVASPAVANQGLLLVLTVLRLIVGGLAGFFLVFLVDLTVARDERRGWMTWLWGGVAGSVVFALLVYFDTLLRETAASTGLSYAALTGMVWGFPIGLGRVWMLKGSHSRWQIIPVIALLCGLVLMLVDQLNPVLADASTLTVFLPGTVVPFAILVAAHLADP